MQRSVDVLIVGAGVAGCAAALGLRARGRSVCLLERGGALAVGESATPDVAPALARLGLQPDWAALALPYHANLACWGSAQLQYQAFLQRHSRAFGHGWHLQRAAFNQWLQQACVDAGATILPARLHSVQPQGTGWGVHYQWRGSAHSAQPDAVEGELVAPAAAAPAFAAASEYAAADPPAAMELALAAQTETPAALPQLHARLLLDAGGRRAPLARLLGIAPQRLDRLCAQLMPAPPSARLRGASLIEACADGWWYAADAPGGQTVLMLMSDADLLPQIDLHASWRSTLHLQQHFAPDWLPAAGPLCAAHSAFLPRAAGDNWLALGDALLAFDPLTSSGISAALHDAEAAQGVLEVLLDGSPQQRQAAGQQWASRANRSLQSYLQGLRQHYAQETRWPHAPFWARRQPQAQVA